MRIVAGKYRGRALAAPKTQAVRPTSDRLREAVFNVLSHAYDDPLRDARVLDLFAGSGALGLESLSRGAAHATLVERDPALAAAISTIANRLGAAAEVINGDALAWLGRAPVRRHDIAFVDPPFADGLWEAVLAALPAHLADDAWLYVESGSTQSPDPGAGWQLHRQGSTREVRYALYRRRGTATLPVDSTL